MVGMVMTKMRATVQARGIFYKAIVKSVLLYGSKSWLVTGSMLNVLEGFQHRTVIRIAGTKERRMTIGDWE